MVPQLTTAGRRAEATATLALSSVARQAGDILGGPEADLLKECGRPACTQICLDRSDEAAAYRYASVKRPVTATSHQVARFCIQYSVGNID